MPLLLASSLRTQKYCFSPSGWREASTANLSSFVRVRRLSRLRFQRHDKLKKESSLIGCYVGFSCEFDLGVNRGHGAREALSLSNPLQLTFLIVSLP